MYIYIYSLYILVYIYICICIVIPTHKHQNNGKQNHEPSPVANWKLLGFQPSCDIVFALVIIEHIRSFTLEMGFFNINNERLMYIYIYFSTYMYIYFSTSTYSTIYSDKTSTFAAFSNGIGLTEQLKTLAFDGL